MIKFEKVGRFQDVNLPLPIRSTIAAAGYDFVVAEDIVIPPYNRKWEVVEAEHWPEFSGKEFTLSETADMCKQYKTKPTLVSTGMKCYLDPGYYLELSVRSSTPLKYGLFLANGVGIIDPDYADNPDNEGEIFFQVINLTPWAITLKRGDKIGQGIIKKYCLTDSDIVNNIPRVGGFGSTGSQMGNETINQVIKTNYKPLDFYYHTTGDAPEAHYETTST